MNAETIAISLDLINRLHQEPNRDLAHLNVTGLSPAEFLTAHIARIGCVHLTETSFVDTQDIWKTSNPECSETRTTQVFRDPGMGPHRRVPIDPPVVSAH